MQPLLDATLGDCISSSERSGDSAVRSEAGTLVCACCLTLAAVGAGTVLGASSGGAATAGWYVASTPGTGGDDILLGSSCANSVQCMAVGITLNNIDSNGTDTPLVEFWNGSSWTLGAQPPVPTDAGGGLFDVSCLSGSDCWAVGAVVGVDGDGNPSAALIENWNGVFLVDDPESGADRSRGGRRSPAGRELRVGVQLRRRRVLDRRQRRQPPYGDGAVERIAWSLVPAAGHRSSLRSAGQRPVSRRRRLLGRGQRRPGPARPELPPHLPGRRSAIKGSSSTGTALLGR